MSCGHKYLYLISYSCQKCNSQLANQQMQAGLEQFPFAADYEINSMTLLGEGSYGRVFKSKNKRTGQEVAIKQINMKKIRDQELEQALNTEINLMKQLKSESVVELIDSHVGKNYSYMIMELCDTDLRKLMKKGKLKEEDCVKIFGEVMNAFKILVQTSCIHRDVKPENVLLKNNKAKLADFGFARKADLLCMNKYDEMCGTPIYMSPQILNNQPYTSKCDIWSLGLMLYETIYGSAPWPSRCIQSYAEAIQKRPLAFPFDVKIGKQTKDFIKRSLVVDEDKRMNWVEVFQHPLIKDKITGQCDITKPVQPKIRLIMIKMQDQAERRQINQVQIFQKYSKLDTLSPAQFSQLLNELNPTITSYEISVLFETCDKNNSGTIDRSEFEELFCTVNYKTDPEIERQIDEILGIMRVKNISLGEMFDKFDKNKTKALDYNQFMEMIMWLAPRYDRQIVHKLYAKLDLNHSGLIDKKEFLKVFGGGLATQKSYVGIWSQKAARNLKMLKVHIDSKKMTADQVMKMADLNYDTKIDHQQFNRLMEKLSFTITAKQIEEVFKYIDVNGNDKISIEQLVQYLK